MRTGIKDGKNLPPPPHMFFQKFVTAGGFVFSSFWNGKNITNRPYYNMWRIDIHCILCSQISVLWQWSISTQMFNISPPSVASFTIWQLGWSIQSAKSHRLSPNQLNFHTASQNVTKQYKKVKSNESKHEEEEVWQHGLWLLSSEVSSITRVTSVKSVQKCHSLA